MLTLEMNNIVFNEIISDSNSIKNIAKNRHRSIIQVKYPKNEDCAICLNTMYKKCVKCTPCGHVYHASCFKKQLESKYAQKYSCSICRNNLLNSLSYYDLKTSLTRIRTPRIRRRIMTPLVHVDSGEEEEISAPGVSVEENEVTNIEEVDEEINENENENEKENESWGRELDDWTVNEPITSNEESSNLSLETPYIEPVTYTGVRERHVRINCRCSSCVSRNTRLFMLDYGDEL